MKLVIISFTILIIIMAAAALAEGDPYIDNVVKISFGENADPLYSDPAKVLGPPRSYDETGLGGSEDVLNIGVGGSVTVEFVDNVIYDGPGPDFTVFENPFYIGGDFSRVYLEPGIVFVSSDNDSYTSFPADYEMPEEVPPGGDDDPDHYHYIAGIRPVFSNPENGIDPLDPDISGGDSFDLADIALQAEKDGVDINNIRFIKIVDVIRREDRDVDGDIIIGTSNPLVNGFDLDAIAAINSKIPEEPNEAKSGWSRYE